VNRPIKRLLALAGSATVGLFAVVAFASPAQAHHPQVSGKADCVNGEYVITWKVQHSTDRGREMEIVAITSTTPLAGDIVLNKRIPEGGFVTGTQRVPGNVDKSKVKLKIEGKWWETRDPNKGNAANVRNTTDEKGPVWPKDGGCTPPPPAPDPTVSFRPECDGTVTVSLVNTHTAPVTVTITGVKDPVVVPTGTTPTHVTVPAGTTGPIIVLAGQKEIGKSEGWTRPQACTPPAGVGESTCDTFKVTVTNPQGGVASEVTVTYGTQVKKVTVGAGESKIVELTPSTETDAVLTYSGWAEHSQIVKYVKPADCPGLPVTGDNTTTYIASGVGLVIVGFGAFYLARRRMAQLRKLAA
jgi:LPXTG-motif cell wall-anchored protein